MYLFTALHTRRSVRAYTDQAVSSQEIHTLLDAAMIAPSAGNAQPWRFVVIDDPELLKKVPALNQYAGMAPQAPVSILICGDPGAEKHKGFWVQDCSAAIQNMLLAATGLGLGTVWTGIYPVEERVKGFRELVGLPEDIIPLGLVVIGRPAKEMERISRFDAAKVYHNTWGKSKNF